MLITFYYHIQPIGSASTAEKTTQNYSGFFIRLHMEPLIDSFGSFESFGKSHFGEQKPEDFIEKYLGTIGVVVKRTKIKTKKYLECYHFDGWPTLTKLFNFFRKPFNKYPEFAYLVEVDETLLLLHDRQQIREEIKKRIKEEHARVLY